MTVYVLVEVHYDYHRFQDNFGVFKTKEEAEAYGKEIIPHYDVYYYNEGHHDELDKSEECHWCIEEYEI